MKGLGMLYQGYRAVARSLLITIVFALVVALPASASAGEVTRGRFHTFAAGIDRDYDISGRAQMVRTANDETIVHVHVKGLAPHTAYGVHVHNKACDDANGGGHYRHDPAGDVNPVNEIWPGFTTNAAGIGNGWAKNDFRARPEAQSIVVHDTDSSRIACANLQP
jgi:hypothetical protein